jgi:hypothetical protein
MTKLIIVIFFFWHAAHVHVAAHVPKVHARVVHVHVQNVHDRSCSSYVHVHGHVNLFFLYWQAAKKLPTKAKNATFFFLLQLNGFTLHSRHQLNKI